MRTLKESLRNMSAVVDFVPNFSLLDPHIELVIELEARNIQ